MMVESFPRRPVQPVCAHDRPRRVPRRQVAVVGIALSTLIGLGAAQGARAEEHRLAAAQGPIRQACSVEIQTYCSDVTPGDGRLRACLSSHRDELTTDCRNALDSGNSRGD
jgi:Cysteine rich repeat